MARHDERDRLDRDKAGRYGGPIGRVNPNLDRPDAGWSDDRRGGYGGWTWPFGRLLDPYGYGSGGPYAGRGPRGYKRSDERLHDEVSERLSEHGHLDASDVEVSTRDAEVTLVGTVEDRRQKRLADDLAASVPGIRDVHNRLKIGRRGLGERIADAITPG